ncbi:MAG: holB, partial [Chloroflexota bacterium]|nr:holB [Chloroflexota bacterium]
MDGARTRGQPAALAAVRSMIRGVGPHAVLLVGPAGVGKTTLALDLAAGLLCTADDPAARPCGACRACRLVASGGHPDLHRVGPEGPGRQVVIGGPGARVRGIRDLIAELALLPVEGGARVAIVEAAHRMNEDAQAALLKTLEEPPAAVTLILCADAEEPLLPTIRSRCARLRLGPVGTRDVEAILAEHGVADAPLASRLARITGGRPGLAWALARQPEALRVRDELSRSLLDLLAARPAERLAGVRAAMLRVGSLTTMGDGAAEPTSVVGPPTSSAASEAFDASGDLGDEAGTNVRTPAAERRRAAEALIGLWSDTARDLALCRRGLERSMRDIGLLDETTAMAQRLDAGELDAFLDRLGRGSVL